MLRFFLLLFSLGHITINAQVQDLTKKSVLIDDFEKNTTVSLKGSRWYTFTDSLNGGKSKITPAWQAINNGIFTIKYSLNKGQFKWNPYVSWGVPLVDSQFTGSLSRFKGLSYNYKGGSHIISVPLQNINDYAHYQKVVPSSENWTTAIIPFNQLKQPSWGRPSEFLIEELQGLMWQATGNTHDTGTVNIDEVRLLKSIPQAKERNKIPAVEVVKDEPKLPPKKFELVTIADWFNFSNAAYSLTFDDGLRSQYTYVLPILERYGLVGTFYVVPPFLAETKETPSWRYGYWKEFIEIANKGHEIGAHSMTHQKLTELEIGDEKSSGTMLYELAEPINRLKIKIPNYQATSMAYPYTDYNQTVSNASTQYYIAARGGIGSQGNAKSPTTLSALESQTISYGSERTLSSDLKKVETIQKVILENIIPNKRWGIFLAHDVLPFSSALEATDSWHPISEESFEKFASWLQLQINNKNLWVSSVGNVAKYIKERDRASVEVIEQTENKIIIHVSDDLPNQVYNQPLSLQFKFPIGWKKVEILVNNQNITLDEKVDMVRFNLIPDSGKVVINKIN